MWDHCTVVLDNNQLIKILMNNSLGAKNGNNPIPKIPERNISSAAGDDLLSLLLYSPRGQPNHFTVWERDFNRSLEDDWGRVA